MNLYLISQNEVFDYDTYDSAVVAALTEADAANTPPDGDWGVDWCSSPSKVNVMLLGKAVPGMPAGVILASFNAG